MRPPKNLLIDGDFLAYRHAVTIEQDIDWGDDVTTNTADTGLGIQRLDNAIAALKETLGPRGKVLIFLSDPTDNFRKHLDPTYKAHRDTKKRPTALLDLKQHLVAEHGASWLASLEADDVMGITATTKGARWIMVSNDKDMRTVPGWHYDPTKPLNGIVQVTEEQADCNMFFQALVGDSVDNYKGCPGIGPVKATLILDVPPRDRWKATADAFGRAGLSWDDFLTQVRLARILRASDYCHKTGRVQLWNP